MPFRREVSRDALSVPVDLRKKRISNSDMCDFGLPVSLRNWLSSQDTYHSQLAERDMGQTSSPMVWNLECLDSFVG